MSSEFNRTVEYKRIATFINKQSCVIETSHNNLSKFDLYETKPTRYRRTVKPLNQKVIKTLQILI